MRRLSPEQATEKSQTQSVSRAPGHAVSARPGAFHLTNPEIAVDGLKNAEKAFTLHGMYGIEILCEIEYQHREGERCSQAYLN